MPTPLQQTARRRVLVFLICVIAFSAVAYGLIFRKGFTRSSTLVMMWCPALAAIVTSLLTGRSVKQVRFGLGKKKWLAAGWLLPVAYALPAYLFVWFSGVGGFPNPVFLERARANLNLWPGRPDWFVIVSAFGFIATILALLGMIAALGEEIGWRGLLVPDRTAAAHA